MLVVADQQRPALRQPGQCPLHDPAAGLAAARAPLRAGALTGRAGVPDVPMLLDHLTGRGVVEPGVQAEMLLDLLGVGALHHDRLDRLIEQLEVRDVGPGRDNPERAAVAVD